MPRLCGRFIGGLVAAITLGGGLNAGYAAQVRLAAVINTAGGVEWGFGVRKVTKAATGIYCIRPNPKTNINVEKARPVATVDYTGANVVGFVLNRSSRIDCPDGTIEIMTFNAAGTLTDLQFSIIVP